MIITKLIANDLIVKNYVEDDSLLFKRENELWGYTSGGVPNYITIPDLDKGTNAITYCGTLPDVTGAWVLNIIRYRIVLYRYADGRIMIRNYQSGDGIVVQSAEVDGIQPYVAITLYFPTETTQEITLSVEGEEPISNMGSWNGSTTQSYVAMVTNDTIATVPMDLALVYNRVLTDAELEQNYQAFLARHR